jgi:sterol desaturase/sphingolipid hydroxylase (fatty acid hydroxylase superfamily)
MNTVPELSLSAPYLIALVSFGSFFLLFVLQYFWPRRDLTVSGKSRVFQNLILFTVNTLFMRLLVPITLVASAQWATQSGWGLFNLIQLNLVQIDRWFAIVACVVFLDFAVYWQHVATHKIPLLWRMHKVHHADHDMDLSTAIRFHPFELLLSLLFKALLIVLLGAPVAAVLIFELLLFTGPAFNHSNLNVPAWLDAKLRWAVATPDVHRAHHSVLVTEQNTNYGFFLIWWDKLFGSYTAQPAAGHAEMQIGITNIGKSCERADKMLVTPFF